jgi:oligosaccharide reducing-end xylanase
MRPHALPVAGGQRRARLLPLLLMMIMELPQQDKTAQAQLRAPPPRPPAQGAWHTGLYRDLFVESGRHTASESAAKVEAAFQQLFHGRQDTEALFYWTDASEVEAYILSIDEQDVRSEGMSYGMMIAVQLDKRREFDALFHFAKRHMQHTDPTDPRFGYFAWHVRPTGQILDPNPASDGEVYLTTALFFAASRWGKPPAGAAGWDYEAEANLILHACTHKENGGSGGGGGRSRSVATNMFSSAEAQVVFVPSEDSAEFTDPSCACVIVVVH